MCLGVPGQVVEVSPDAQGVVMGKVRFGDIAREVCLAYVPEVGVGEWVLVHVGFAIQRIDEEAARGIFDALAELEATGAQVEAEARSARTDGPPDRDRA